ncbi:Dihydrolipoyllysine-residue succinyltransferase component of 2-oxoglutarate dehydrogenase complex, mitochondrial [Hondaea fermentalgiana]|uniref:Dihydrolipoyllysine-residue succinyltransferase component of 2-oxoglutarate dehydrogenase complex, mitochondrial n=1 Tax=Hondaea fermentalgiana TaxID=2315210 RepID=A0A2R5GJR8_9STRA|nr:Dihydrolipoyllysine-residue succinyltransferase component of 2-oxoglutarate dehydrogenase complex, mitochondrial [Hondaea fermentalgiana]|eukprot:GBG31127.1 Dihydrolipoyllysine-residue succinyltransferase component of 2-oxoglutarate dehydrogenase complex, mitochondrial [Hondaea fermentalgiana]
MLARCVKASPARALALSVARNNKAVATHLGGRVSVLGVAGDAAPAMMQRHAGAMAASIRGFRASGLQLESVTVPVPAMGEAVTQGDIVEWLKQPGDSVEVDEVICVIETDKVAVDIRSPAAGTLTKQLANVEDTVNTDQPIAEIELGDAAASSPKASSGADKKDEEPAKEAPKAPAADQEPVTVPVPAMGEAVTQGDLVEWIKQPGDSVEVDEVICVIETDKVAVDIRSPVAGTLTEQLAKVEDTVHTDQPIAKIEPGDGAAAPKSGAADATPTPSGEDTSSAPSSQQSSHDDNLEPLKQPMIHFRYGKRDVIDKEMGILPANSGSAAGYAESGSGASGTSAAPAEPTTRHTDVRSSPGMPETVVEYMDNVPATFGRLPPLTEEEALRIQLGGADP